VGDQRTPGRITRRKQRMAGEPCVGGTRITSACIYSWYVQGHDRERILRLYEYLDPRDVDAAIAFEQGRLYERRKHAALRNTVKNMLRALRALETGRG